MEERHKDTSKQVHQVTMATRECGLKLMSPLFQEGGSKWHPSGLTTQMHLPRYSGLLVQSAGGTEEEKDHSNLVSSGLPSASQEKTLVSRDISALISGASPDCKSSRILAFSYFPTARECRHLPSCLKSKIHCA